MSCQCFGVGMRKRGGSKTTPRNASLGDLEDDTAAETRRAAGKAGLILRGMRIEDVKVRASQLRFTCWCPFHKESPFPPGCSLKSPKQLLKTTGN